MRPTCTDCTPVKYMKCARLICGCFTWRGYICPDCQDVMFLHRTDRLGFKMTQWLFKGEIMLFDAHRI